jgi:hypothetical protein
MNSYCARWIIFSHLHLVSFLNPPSTDKIVKISNFSDFNENLYLGLFWFEELIGNDENCIQGHFYWKVLPWQHTSNVVIRFNRQYSKVKDFDIRSRFPWHWRPFWKFHDPNAPLEMGIHLPVKISKDRIINLRIWSDKLASEKRKKNNNNNN